MRHDLKIQSFCLPVLSFLQAMSCKFAAKKIQALPLILPINSNITLSFLMHMSELISSQMQVQGRESNL